MWRRAVDWLRQFYPYKYGRPSHDTLVEFYSRLNPKEFVKCLIAFTESLADHSVSHNQYAIMSMNT
ncbi:transposase family protein [Flavobacterium marginilacus]|uniref:transposase family protein n=1 Tax=Flavobacterium marginilacus TaxID=3003256 RepID=UPI003D791B70